MVIFYGGVFSEGVTHCVVQYSNDVRHVELNVSHFLRD